MSIDRDAALKRAEKCLRQGRLDGAIDEYLRLVDDQPRDWAALNALGDLYLRAGDADCAVTQFNRVADHCFEEGFFPKAAALYKKSLKARADHEPTLVRLAEVASLQKLLADAKAYYRQLVGLRRAQGDASGAADYLARLAAVDESDADARLAAATAAEAIGESARAVELLTQAADLLEEQDRASEAFETRVRAVRLDASDRGLLVRLARQCLESGQIERAREFLTPETAGSDPDLLLVVAGGQVSEGRDAEARTVLTHVLSLAPDRERDVLRLATDLASRGYLDRAFSCADVAVEAAVLDGDLPRAARALQNLLAHGRHSGALVKLVEICVDADLTGPMREAQAELAESFLEEGRAAEARVIAEDLVAFDPTSHEHRDRLRRALVQLDVDDVDDIVAAHVALAEAPRDLDDLLSFDVVDAPDAVAVTVAGSGAFAGGLDGDDTSASAPVSPGVSPASSISPAPTSVELPSAHVLADPAPAAPPQQLLPSRRPTVGDVAREEAHAIVDLEFDLSDVLRHIGPSTSSGNVPAAAVECFGSTEPIAQDSPAPRPAPAPPNVDELDRMFSAIRAQVAIEQDASGAAGRYAYALAALDNARVEEGMTVLQEVARAPVLRFQASSRLARLYLERNELDAAIDWFERASEAPAPTPDEGFDLLYQLADALERSGELARALAVLMELDADTDGFRDVRARVERLSRVQAGSY